MNHGPDQGKLPQRTLLSSICQRQDQMKSFDLKTLHCPWLRPWGPRPKQGSHRPEWGEQWQEVGSVVNPSLSTHALRWTDHSWHLVEPEFLEHTLKKIFFYQNQPLKRGSEHKGKTTTRNTFVQLLSHILFPSVPSGQCPRTPPSSAWQQAQGCTGQTTSSRNKSESPACPFAFMLSRCEDVRHRGAAASPDTLTGHHKNAQRPCTSEVVSIINNLLFVLEF